MVTVLFGSYILHLLKWVCSTVTTLAFGGSVDVKFHVLKISLCEVVPKTHNAKVKHIYLCGPPFDLNL